MRSDVVIVGGGPAGAVTGLLLAREGYQVTLLDRARFPRAKPCGDCISPGANPLLRRLGVWDDILSTHPAQLRGWRLETMHGSRTESFAASFSDTGTESTALALPRRSLDAVLLDHARRQGVYVVQDARVVNILRPEDGAVTGVRARQGDENADWFARLVVGADGIRSVVARKLNAHSRRPRMRKLSLTVHLRMRRQSDYGTMVVNDGMCLGIAPLESLGEEPLHNLTLVVPHAWSEKLTGARQMLAAAREWFPHLPAIAPEQEVLASGPFDWPVARTAFDGAALAGDAAGYYDPFTGQGIYQAIAGAELLAEHAAHALRRTRVTRSSLQRYARAHRQLTGPARHVQRLVEFVCARPRLAQHAFARLARRSSVARALIAVTGDLVPPRALLSPQLLARLVL